MSLNTSKTSPLAICLVGLGLTLLGLALSIRHGSSGTVPWSELLYTDFDAHPLLWEVRMPRAFGALCAGALLGLCGAIAQGVFRNPLAEPYLLGSASGASLGVVVGHVVLGTGTGLSVWMYQLGVTGSAFMGAVGAVVLSIGFSAGARNGLKMILSGVVVGVVLGAIASLIGLLRPDVLPLMQSFALGSTAFLSWPQVGILLAVALAVAALSLWLAPVLDALLLGEHTAHSLGFEVPKLRGALIAAMALGTGTAVAYTGLIGFIGLAAPHMVRSMHSPLHRPLLIGSAMMGGLLLLYADLVSRTVFAPVELPVGSLTAVLGGAYLLVRMHRTRGAA